MAMAEMEGRRQGNRYVVTAEEVAKYRNDGYVHLKVTFNYGFWFRLCLSRFLTMPVDVLVLRHVAPYLSLSGHVLRLDVQFLYGLGFL